MDDDLKQRLTSGELWMRALYMLLLTIAYGVAELLVAIIAVFQFFAILFTGSANQWLLKFGFNLGSYIRQIVRFVTFNSEDKPFPFSEWPDETPEPTRWESKPTSEPESDPEPEPDPDPARAAQPSGSGAID